MPLAAHARGEMATHAGRQGSGGWGAARHSTPRMTKRQPWKFMRLVPQPAVRGGVGWEGRWGAADGQRSTSPTDMGVVARWVHFPSEVAGRLPMDPPSRPSRS